MSFKEGLQYQVDDRRTLEDLKDLVDNLRTDGGYTGQIAADAIVALRAQALHYKAKADAAPRGGAASVPLFECRFRPGDRLRVGDGGVITAVVEEVIMQRGMAQPVYLLQWWVDGDIVTRRFLEEECAPA